MQFREKYIKYIKPPTEVAIDDLDEDMQQLAPNGLHGKRAHNIESVGGLVAHAPQGVSIQEEGILCAPHNSIPNMYEFNIFR